MIIFSVEASGFGTGFDFSSGSTPSSSSNSIGPLSKLNQFMVQNLQSLIAANPSLLTAGIPNQLLTSLWNQAPKMTYDVC